MAADSAVVQPMIQAAGLTFVYGEGAPVFRDFSWQVQTGEAWAVIGSSGCGKSTLLYLIAGLRQPSAGRLVVDRPAGGAASAPASDWCCRTMAACPGPRCGKTWRCRCGWASLSA